MKFALNQKWYSLGEPELGVGNIIEVAGKTLTLYFEQAQEPRTYSALSSPLKRLVYDIGDEIELESGKFKVTRTEQEGSLFIYYNEADEQLRETQLPSNINLTGAFDKLVSLNFDNSMLFDARYSAFLSRRKYEQFPYKGLLGGKVSLLPHQAYITASVANRERARIFLSDEVGLGKTIEASLILSAMKLSGKVNRTLIVVPDSLVYQWYFELKFKFNLNFRPISMKDELGVEALGVDEAQDFIISAMKLRTDKKLLGQVIEDSWDCLIVDEAHRMNTEMDLAILDELGARTSHLLFLSATPRLNGNEAYFSLLEILEPNKFTSFEDFMDKEKTYKEVLILVEKIINADFSHDDIKKLFPDSDISLLQTQQQIIDKIIERFGTGRFMFRNTREYLAKYELFFPKRKLSAYPITKKAGSDNLNFSLKMDVLRDVLDKVQEKVLLIVRSKALAAKIVSSLEQTSTRKVATFNSDQSLMERDRQAAYFSENDGADILVCTEVGSEGRNFEFASHLFFFDLPESSDLVEQRIGRLDRVGQKKDITLHVPYFVDSTEESLFRINHEILNIFQAPARGVTRFHEMFQTQLKAIMHQDDTLEQHIDSFQAAYLQIVEDLKAGSDRLAEINSFDLDKSKQIVNAVNDFNNHSCLLSFLENCFDVLGVHFEEIKKDIFYIAPTDTMRVPSLGALPEDGLSVTAQRSIAIARNDLSFISWEHPLVSSLQETFLNSELGNCVLAQQDSLAAPVLFEFIFRLEATKAKGTLANFYLPLTPIRVLIGSSGEELTKKIPKKLLDEVCSHLSDTSSLESISKEGLKKLKDLASKIAVTRAQKYIQQAIEQSELYYNEQLDNLDYLFKTNPYVSEDEISLIKTRKLQTKEVIEVSKVSLDSIRVILKTE